MEKIFILLFWSAILYKFLAVVLCLTEQKNFMSSDNRGLASADEETRKRVAREGGKAPHEERGLQAADEDTRERVAREGGKS